MKQIDIAETIADGIEKSIFEQWKHEGYIDSWNSNVIKFEVDGKRYILRLWEVEE